MVYVRKKIIKGKEYYYIVKGVKGKQKVIAYLGNREALKKFYENVKKKLE